MKQQQLILEPCDNFGGYVFLKFMFAEDATDYFNNFDLLITYLSDTYNRKDMGKKGKTIAVKVSSDNDEVLFIDDNTACKYYLFPINRSEAIKRLNEVADFIDDIKGDLELSMHIKIKTRYDDKNDMDDAIIITIRDIPVPRYKKMLRIFPILFPNIFIKYFQQDPKFKDGQRHYPGDVSKPWIV